MSDTRIPETHMPETCNTIKQCQIPGCLPAPTWSGYLTRATVRWTYLGENDHM